MIYSREGDDASLIQVDRFDCFILDGGCDGSGRHKLWLCNYSQGLLLVFMLQVFHVAPYRHDSIELFLLRLRRPSILDILRMTYIGDGGLLDSHA